MLHAAVLETGRNTKKPVTTGSPDTVAGIVAWRSRHRQLRCAGAEDLSVGPGGGADRCEQHGQQPSAGLLVSGVAAAAVVGIGSGATRVQHQPSGSGRRKLHARTSDRTTRLAILAS